MRKNKRYTGQTLNEIGALAFSSNRTLLASIFFFLVGISTGVFLELTMSAGEKNNLASALQEYLSADGANLAFHTSFGASISNNLALLLIIFIAGLSILGFPAAYAVVAYKGMALGFCSGLILENLQSKGLAVICTSLLPQNLLLIPAFILACTIASNYAFHSLRRRKEPQKKNLTETSGSYILSMVLLTVIIILSALIETILYSIVPLP